MRKVIQKQDKIGEMVKLVVLYGWFDFSKNNTTKCESEY